MKRRYKTDGLNFVNETKKRTRTFVTFTVAFLCFALVLSVASFLVLFKSANYNLSNLVDRKTTVTEENSQSETTTVPVEYSGVYNVLAVCSDSGKNLNFFGIINLDMDNKQVSVYTFSNSGKAILNGTEKSFSEYFSSGGVLGLKQAVEVFSGIEIDRYFSVTETNFKKIISSLGDVTITSDKKINTKGDGYVLNLEKGEQSVTGDTLLGYYKYSNDLDKSKITATILDYYIVTGKLTATSSKFNSVINYLQTDISMKDFTENYQKVNAFFNDTQRKPTASANDYKLFIREGNNNG